MSLEQNKSFLNHHRELFQRDIGGLLFCEFLQHDTPTRTLYCSAP
jgi:hypothetical protein